MNPYQRNLHGWERRFTVEAHRGPEYEALYTEMGLEVEMERLDTSGDDCTVCFEEAPEAMVVIWTRDPRASKGASPLPVLSDGD